MSVRTLFERDTLEVGDDRSLGVLTLSQKRLLAKLESSLPKGTLGWTAKGLRLGSFCGVLQVGTDTWEILPKIWRGDEEVDKNRGLLLHLLQLSHRLPWLKSWPGALGRQRHHLLDVFIAKFSKDLEEAMVSGLARSYRPEREELPVLRGRLDVTDHARRLQSNKHRMVCLFDEFDEDISLNRVLRHCVEKLSELVGSPSLRNILDELRFRFDEVSPWRFNRLELDRIRLNRTQARFAAVWEQCRWLLCGLYPDASAGPHPHASLLFDMEVLFEEATSSIIRRELSPRGYQCHFQGPRQALLSDVGGDKKYRYMKPDIFLVTPSGRRIILDCKWKELDPKGEVFGVSQADMYQLHTYAGEYGAQAAGLVFPWVPGLPIEPQQFRFREIGIPIWILFVPMEKFIQRQGGVTENWGEAIK